MIKNKKGDIPTTILVIGTIAICLLSLLSFTLTNNKIRNLFSGLAVTEALNSQTEEDVFCANNPSCIRKSSASFTLNKRMIDANQNVMVNRKCFCIVDQLTEENKGENCLSYANYIENAVKDYGISDSFLLLSLMMQENSCRPSECSYSEYTTNIFGTKTGVPGKELACGIMQINLIHCKSSFYEKAILTKECYTQLAGMSQECKDKLPVFEDNCAKNRKVSDKCKNDYPLAIKNCKNNLIEDKNLSIRIGAQILKQNYNTLNQICNSNKPCTPKYADYCGKDHQCQARCNAEGKCEYEFVGCGSVESKFYSGWEAAVRAYNGWGCDETNHAQDTYAEDVFERYYLLSGKVLTNQGKDFSIKYIKN